jgi:hypothetical protein
MDYEGKVGFVIGTGRCGTVFYTKLGEMEPHVAASHERFPLNETFHRYCKWHDLPVDSEGFLATKEREIRDDLRRHEFSLEASPHLSLSVVELYERFGAKFILLVRAPHQVVSSFLKKGFYREPYVVKDPALCPSYQQVPGDMFETFLARISPRGEYFHAWNGMTRIGKIAWFYRAYTERTLEKLAQLPDEAYRIIRIEDFDYDAYLGASRFLGYESRIRREQFAALAASRPHSFQKKKEIYQWSAQEIAEFEEQVRPVAERFGYPWKVNEIMKASYGTEDAEKVAATRMRPKTGPRFWRARKTAAAFFSKLADLVDVP